MADIKTASPLPTHSTGPNGAPKRWLLWPMIAMIGVVLIIVLIIGGVKLTQISKAIAASKVPQPPVVVTALNAQFADWQPSVSAVGSIKTILGVDITTSGNGHCTGAGHRLSVLIEHHRGLDNRELPRPGRDLVFGSASAF